MAYDLISTLDHPIFQEQEGPFITIYQTTHREPSKNEEDSLHFKNLIKAAEKQLETHYPNEDPAKILNPLQEIQSNTQFWNQTQEGIAIFSNRTHTVAFRFSQPIRDVAVVSKTLYVIPLIRLFQTLDDYYVLALSKDSFRLFSGNRGKVSEVSFDESVPTTKNDVLGTLETDNNVTYGSYGGAGGGAQFHGHEDAKKVEEEDMQRFFRYVDDLVKDNYTKTSNSSLILWALPKAQGVFRKISKNHNLMEDGVEKSTKDLTEDQVRDQTWSIIEPIYKDEVNALVKRFNTAVFKEQASDVFTEVFEAALNGRVDTFLIEEGRIIPGYLNDKNEPVIFEETSKDTHDLLDTLAKLIIEQGGTIRVLSKDKMPTNTGFAAIYRY
jgi:hypothetical protein